jgi:hypothetical protein
MICTIAGVNRRMFAGISVWNDLWIARDAAQQTSEQAVAALLAHRATS